MYIIIADLRHVNLKKYHCINPIKHKNTIPKSTAVL